MTEHHNFSGDILMPTDLVDVALATQLNFARGKVGQRYPLTTDEERAAFARECAEHTLQLTVTNTADCGDERVTIALGDHTTDPAALQARIAPQMFGGLYLATTKAAVEAQAAVVKDAKSFMGAFLVIKQVLNGMGYHDAAHQSCGAEKAVKESVEKQLSFEAVVGSAALLAGKDDSNERLLTSNTVHKRRLLDAGFYDDWSAETRKDQIMEDAPENYSFLKEDPADLETGGHNGSGLYVVTQDGVGYQKTGRAFSVTVPKMIEISQKIGGSDEERRRILLGFVDDTLHVGAGIVTEGFPVFAQTA